MSTKLADGRTKPLASIISVVADGGCRSPDFKPHLAAHSCRCRQARPPAMAQNHMDLTDAINAHTDWKIRLRGAISDQSALDVDTIARDDCCELGRWLHGLSKDKFGALPAHGECLTAHASFHRCAADVAATINAREYAKAEQMLSAGSRYALASRVIVLAIEALRRQAADQGRAPGTATDA